MDRELPGALPQRPSSAVSQHNVWCSSTKAFLSANPPPLLQAFLSDSNACAARMGPFCMSAGVIRLKRVEARLDRACVLRTLMEEVWDGRK